MPSGPGDWQRLFRLFGELMELWGELMFGLVELPVVFWFLLKFEFEFSTALVKICWPEVVIEGSMLTRVDSWRWGRSLRLVVGLVSSLMELLRVGCMGGGFWRKN